MPLEDFKDPGPDRDPPRYRRALLKLPAEPGWLSIVDENSPQQVALCVPWRVGLELIASSQRLWDERARAALAAATSDPRAEFDDVLAGSPKTVSSANKLSRSKPHQVTMPDPVRFLEPEPLPSGCWVRIWDAEPVRELINRHNAGDGSADKGDRERNAAAWQQQVDAGPWRRCVAPPDPHQAMATLRAELGHLAALCDRIEERLLLAHHEGKPFTVPPILLVGAPGVGKSYAVRRLAEILGLPLSMLDMSSLQTNGRLHGADKHWANATPGLLRELVIGGQVANPVLLLDEIDKTPRAGSSNRYDPLGPLHAALEPGTARRTEDQCIAGPFDASHVIYIATANSLAPMPDSLLSRFQIVLCQAPGVRQALSAAQRIAAEVTASLNGFAPADRAVVAALAEHTPRAMRQLLETALARAVKAGRRHLELRDLGRDDGETGALH
jgi:ATP-dependent Lon protease